MAAAPPTRPSLLVRLRDFRDHDAWTQFVDVYAPLVYGYVRKRGLQHADAADLAQACLRQVALHIGSLEYDPRCGSFRGWLFTIVRNKLHDFRSQPRQRGAGSGDPAVHRLLVACAAPSAEAEEWQREYQRSLLAWAAEQVRPQFQETTWQAFWQTAVENRPAKEVAAELGIKVAAVYLARSRVMARLRALAREAQGAE